MRGDTLKVICARNTIHMQVVVEWFKKAPEVDSDHFTIINKLTVSFKLPPMHFIECLFAYCKYIHIYMYIYSHTFHMWPNGIKLYPSIFHQRRTFRVLIRDFIGYTLGLKSIWWYFSTGSLKTTRNSS